MSESEPVGVFKQCPRCGKLGAVYLNRRLKRLEVSWPAFDGNGEWRASRASVDFFDVDDLLKPTVGCGFDRPRHLNPEAAS